MQTSEANARAAETPREYKTSNMYLAAYLLYAEVSYLRLERGDKKSVFVFERGPGHDKLVNEYFNGKASVPANVFAAKISDVKDLLHSR